MNAKEEALLAEAKEILEKNWEDSYTVPSPDLYPHQWNWDSAFVALGYSRYNRDRAEKELLSIFEGQCDNGMLPHIVFRRKSDYFPGPDYWETDLSENSPSIKTSAITQPPVHAIAALQVYENSIEGEKVESFLEKIFPKILDFHNYLFEERDPEKLGLVTIFHPWESGFDNSTRWDEALARIEVQNLPEYVRTDTNKIDSDQRPKKESYDKYIYLVELMKRQNYKEELFYDEFPFKIKDVVFSSILYDANECLLKMAEILGEDDSMIRGWMRRTEDNYLEYFCIDKEREVLAYDFDLITNRSVVKRTVASLIPVYTDLLKESQVKLIFDWMMHSHVCTKGCVHDHKLATAIPVIAKEYNPLNYWRGPIWINVNWMLYKGLTGYGFIAEADRLRQSIIDLVSEHGFYEHYDPSSGEGLGSDRFSWTASLLIDILYK